MILKATYLDEITKTVKEDLKKIEKVDQLLVGLGKIRLFHGIIEKVYL